MTADRPATGPEPRPWNPTGPDHDCIMPSACGVTGFYCYNSRATGEDAAPRTRRVCWSCEGEHDEGKHSLTPFAVTVDHRPRQIWGGPAVGCTGCDFIGDRWGEHPAAQGAAAPPDGEALYRVWWQASWDAMDNPPQWEQLSKDRSAVWSDTARRLARLSGASTDSTEET